MKEKDYCISKVSRKWVPIRWAAYADERPPYVRNTYPNRTDSSRGKFAVYSRRLWSFLYASVCYRLQMLWICLSIHPITQFSSRRNSMFVFILLPRQTGTRRQSSAYLRPSVRSIVCYQTCQYDILKTNQPISMQIGKSIPQQQRQSLFALNK